MISWICFEWKTGDLPRNAVPSAPFQIRAAQKSELEAVAKTIRSAFAMDSVWGDVSKPLAAKLELDIEAAFELSEPSCVVLVHGTRIIGASLMDPNPDAANHFSSGPCVLYEYRNRGLASQLLAASLAFLHDGGVAVARGLTRHNSLSARFIYPKFGGVPHPFSGDPLKLPAA